MSLLVSLQQCAADAGLNLFGVVDAERFDGCQPQEQRSRRLLRGCGTIVVLGTAGRGFWRSRRDDHRANGADAGGEGADDAAQEGAHCVALRLADLGVCRRVVDSRSGTLNFGRLGEAAGFGIVSPVSGMLLHPTYGPWLRVRAAILATGYPFGAIADASIAEHFRPCCTCSKPCISACPPAVHDGLGNSDRARCADHRHDGGCGNGCFSRLACPVGAEYRDAPDAPLHVHSAGLPTVRRWYGLGVWRIVPRFLRGGPPC